MSDDGAAEAEPAWVNEARELHGLPPIHNTEPDKQPDASDPKAADEARRAQRLDERAIGMTIREMMQLREVRAVIYRWLDVCRAWAPHDFPFGAQLDPLQLARNAAHREVAQYMLADLHRAAPEQYLTMLKENQPD